MKTRLLLVLLSLTLPASLFATITFTVKMPVNAIQNLNYTCSYTTTAPSGTACGYSASGGSGPYTYTVSSGLLPAGLTLNSSTGAVTGHPTATTFTSYTFTVKATDTLSNFGTVTSNVYVAPSAAGMHSVTYPTNVGVVDVTQSPYNADKTGATDASGAIQQAISDIAVSTTSAGGTDASTKPSTRDKIIYLPAGTYRVDHPLVWGSCTGGVWTWAGYIPMIGHNRNDTIIRLVDNAPGYTSGVNPAINSTGCSSITIPSRAVIFTGPNSALGSAANTNSGNSGATGNTGFRNHIMNLTVDIGNGNSAAIGIDYLGSNNCRLSDVNILSEDNNGDTGLSMQRQWQGPNLVKYVTVAGFGKGIALGNGYANWLEHIVVNRQSTAGIYLASGDVASIRDLKSNNTVPAVTNAHNAVSLTLFGSTLQGGINGNTAVNNTATAPHVFIRNTSFPGYSALSNGTNASSCTGEWLTDAPINATTTSSTCSLSLSISETPIFSSDDYTTGAVDITTLGVSKGITAADRSIDQAAAISNAITNATVPTVYFPYGTYYIGTPITINTIHVQRIIFFGAKLSPVDGGFIGNKVLDIQTIPATAGLVIQNALFVTNYDANTQQFFPSSTSGTPIILQEATATAPVTILNSENISYTSNSGAGTLYLESVDFGPFNFTGQTVYARHLNPELCANHVSATGGTVWIFGLKTEDRDNLATCTLTSIPIGNVSNGASFEVLGASIYTGKTNDTAAAMFTFTNSSTSVSSMTTGAVSGSEYDEWVSETRNGNNGYVCAPGYSLGNCSSAVHSYSRPNGSVIPLYMGH